MNTNNYKIRKTEIAVTLKKNTMKVQKTTLVCKQAGQNAAIRKGTRGERHELVKVGKIPVKTCEEGTPDRGTVKSKKGTEVGRQCVLRGLFSWNLWYRETSYAGKTSKGGWDQIKEGPAKGLGVCVCVCKL